jgi:putative ubiquitin-RnfH superfamily antitoxin RatB of RatAB toxin-antitoxin module
MSAPGRPKRECLPPGGTARSAKGAQAGATGRPTIVVGVAWATPELQEIVHVELPAGATVADAVGAARLLTGAADWATAASTAVFGKRAGPATLLAHGDRVEICRPLRLDPGEARRMRAIAKSHGGEPRSRADLPADGK